MQHPELTAFVDHARERGLDPMAIRMLLLSAGWKERDIAQALSAQALELPIPTPPDTGGAREAFLHLLKFAAFYTAAVSLILLLFACIDQVLPDPAMAERVWARGAANRMRGWMAALIVAFPLYMWLSRFLLREIGTRPEKAASGVRRWLTYLTLLVAATTLMCDLIVLVSHLLQGELTLRFVLKVLVLGAVAAVVFVYYLRSLRPDPDPVGQRRLNRGFAATATALVLLTLVWSGFRVGSPMSERLRRLDERRVEDLRAIHDEILRLTLADDGSRRVHPLPRSLEEVARRARTRRPEIRDPESGEPYEYKVLDEDSFRLCATFRLARDEARAPSWNHPAGRHCFPIAIHDTELPPTFRQRVHVVPSSD